MRRFLGVLPYVDERRIRTETAALLDRLHSTIPAKTKSVARLSGGQRQAVAIARAIYWKAKVVIMDEPTAALAVMEREKVVQHARQLAASGAGVIYVGHNLVEILEVADRVAVMFRGAVVHVTNAKDTNQETLIKYMTGYVDQQKRRMKAQTGREAMLRKSTLMATVALFALTGAHTASAQDSVAVIVKATTSEYWQWVFKGAEAAGKELGVKVEELGTPKDDAAGQISVLEGAAGKKPCGHRHFADDLRGAWRADRRGQRRGRSRHRDRFRRQDRQIRFLPHHQQRGGRQGRGRRDGAVHQGAHRQGGGQGRVSSPPWRGMSRSIRATRASRTASPPIRI